MRSPSSDPSVCEALLIALGAQTKAVADAIAEYRPDLAEALLEMAHALRPIPKTHQVDEPRLTLVEIGPVAG
jgi:hypothetical protein